MPGVRPPGARLRRLWLRHRRAGAAVLAAIAVLLGLTALRPASPATVRVLVAARDLPAGATPGPEDVRTAGWPGPIVPAGALSASGDLGGRALAGPVGAGEALTETRLLGTAAFGSGAGPDGGPPGTVGLPVRFADPDAAALLRPGDRLDILAGPPASFGTAALPDPVPARPVPPPAASRARVVATGVTVMGVPRPPADPVLPEPSEGGLVVLAIPPDIAADVAGAATVSPLTYVIRPPAVTTGSVAIRARGAAESSASSSRTSFA